MKLLKLWLWKWRELSLEAQIQNGEATVYYTRARLHQAYRQLRLARTRIAELTPAHRLLKDALARRRRTVASR